MFPTPAKINSFSLGRISAIAATAPRVLRSASSMYCKICPGAESPRRRNVAIASFAASAALGTVSQPVCQQHERSISSKGTPPVSADQLPRIGNGNAGKLHLIRMWSLSQLEHHYSSGSSGKYLQYSGDLLHRSEATAHRPSRGVSVDIALRHIGDSPTLIDRQDPPPPAPRSIVHALQRATWPPPPWIRTLREALLANKRKVP